MELNQMNDVFLIGKSVVNQKLVSQWSNHFCDVSERSWGEKQLQLKARFSTFAASLY